MEQLAAWRSTRRVEELPGLCAEINGAATGREQLFCQLLDFCVVEDGSGLVGPVVVDASKAVLDGLLDEGVQLVVSRAALMHFAVAVERGVAEVVRPKVIEDCSDRALSHFQALHDAKVSDRGRSASAKEARGARLVEVMKHAVTSIQARNSRFEDAELRIRRALALYYHNEDDWLEAAATLSAANVDSASRAHADTDLAMFYTEVAEYYLQAEEEISADQVINRAAQYAHALAASAKTNTRHALYRLRYLVSHARIMDSKRKFFDAARRYYELSHVQDASLGLDADDLLQLLETAITCAILAKAGPGRARLLATICKDERVSTCEHAPLLFAMYREQLLRQRDIERFEQTLKEHQRATGADGLTVLRRAVIEHNVIAASKVYTNIRFSELGALLEVPAEQAEGIVAKMVVTGRLKGSIDQIDGVLEFDSGAEVLQAWDGRIMRICSDMDACLQAIEAKGVKLAPV
eukprot:g716.t1